MENAALGFSGKLNTRVTRGTQKAPLSWKLRNNLRGSFIGGVLAVKAAKLFSKITHIPTVYGELKAVHIDPKTGVRTDYGVISHKMITTAFVEYMVDELVAETTAWGDFKFHDSGVGTTAAAITDTDIETTDAVARVTGTQLEGATGEIYKSVGTITYVSSLAITEHGLFNIVTAGILMDRHVFTAINVVNTDQIEFTYELTVNDGG